MARLQILELPEGAGNDRAPFVLVIDQYEARRYVMGLDQTEQPDASSSSQRPSRSPPTTPAHTSTQHAVASPRMPGTR
jgi:hypothetical protein